MTPSFEVRDLPPAPPAWDYRGRCEHCGLQMVLTVLKEEAKEPPQFEIADCGVCSASVIFELETKAAPEAAKP